LSVLKSLDIDLPQSEKKTLVRFLSLYIFFTLIILGLTSSLYYTLQKELASSQRTIELNEYSNDLIANLKNTDTKIIKNKKFKISLYAKNYKLLYATSSNAKQSLIQVSYTNQKTIRYITNPKEYYLQMQYLVVEIIDNKHWLDQTLKNIYFYGTAFFVMMTVLGYFLLKLFLKPMRDALHLLDTFIKDTTHELNTPVSTIMTNIELIDKESIKDKYLLKIINRIEIGAKTISNIYDDLTYLMLNHKIVSNDHHIDLQVLLKQRVDYFSTLSKIKKIDLQVSLDPSITLLIDEKKLTKLIDNILSNAIKYNKVGGSIYVDLKQNTLNIKNTGKGIPQKNIDRMFERYARFDKVAGGFGIGLNIVKMIADEYNLDVKITSEVNKFTNVCVRW